MVMDNKKTFRRNSKYFITLFFVGLFAVTAFISIGYSALNKSIQVSGDINYDKYEVWAENLSFDSSVTHVNCTDAQCMLDCISDESLCP
jgi:hypothetical protein